MKKALVATIIGVAAVASTFGQGSIIFDNYTQGTYNQVVWGDGTPVQTAISFQLYFGEGVFTDLSQLTAGVSATVNPDYTFVGSAGPGGWFSGQTQVLPNWQAGDVYTFALQITTPGYFLTSPVIWQESDNIHAVNVSQTGFGNFPGATVVVPEPSTLALAGLGSAALLFLRRRK